MTVWLISGNWDNRVIEICATEELAETLAQEMAEELEDVFVTPYEVREN